MNTCSSPWSKEVILGEQTLQEDTSACVTPSTRERVHSLGLHPVIINPTGENTIFTVMCSMRNRLKIKCCLRAGYARL